ncbi:helix-turn-helix domain-containing protein [Noviherbaspirillum sp. 1P10PC]|uniref:helix-turn-helix domain-containing protein n=1 Tax=Noviherbaspirillum sp. 1P10PC TaxID=3132292 RepID=UPI00399FA2E1
MTHDRVIGDDFYLTQEFLAGMLGAHRPTISLVAGSFQPAGALQYNRAHDGSPAGSVGRDQL